MLDVYRRSLFSQTADNMGFASPPRQHPHRNRFRTDGPMYHSDTQDSDTDAGTEAEAEELGLGDGGVDTVHINTGANVGYARQTSTSADQQQEESSSSSGSSLWHEGEAARRESSDGYTAELDDEVTLACNDSAEADFDCGVDSLWD